MRIMQQSRQMSMFFLILISVIGFSLSALAAPTTLTVTPYADLIRFANQGKIEVRIATLNGKTIFFGTSQGILDWNTSQVANGVYLYTVNVEGKKKIGKIAVMRGRGNTAPILTTTPNVGSLIPRDDGGVPQASTGDFTVHDDLIVETSAKIGTPTNLAALMVKPAAIGTYGMVLEANNGQTADLLRVYNPSGTLGMRIDANGTIVARSTTGIQASNAGTGKFSVQSTGASGHTYTFNSNADGSFGMADDTLGLNRWYILANGNFGIGTVGATALLHVNNTANQPALKIDASNGTNAIEVYNTGSGAATGLIYRVERSTGNVYADGSFNCGLTSGSCFNAGTGADVAERIDAIEPMEPGDVVEIHPDQPAKFRKSQSAITTRVAGIISTAPAVTLGNNFDGSKETWNSDTRPLLALAGRVPVKVMAKYGAIQVGDLLVSSPIPGYAMKCPKASECIGAVIGKALEPLAEGVGKIEVQVMLR